MRCLFVCLFVVFFYESKTLVFGVQNSAQGLRNSANDWNPEAIIWNGIQYPRLFCIQPYMGQRLLQERENNMCERIKRLLGSDYLGKGLNREGGLTPDRFTHKIATF